MNMIWGKDMVTYTTKFPVADNFLRDEFIAMVIRWNQGSRFDKIENVQWDGKTYECRWEQGNISLEIQEIPSEKIIASRLEKEDASGVWRTDFVLNYGERYIAVSVMLETTEFTTDFYPRYYPPFFVKMVLFGGYAGEDSGLPVAQMQHLLDEHEEFFRNVVQEKVRTRLPVVFVAKTAEGENPVDPGDLAFRLQGAAHVLCEPEHAVVLQGFSDVLDNQEARAGKVFIFYPGSSKKGRILNLSGTAQNPESLADRIVKDVYNYMNQRMRQSIDTWDGIEAEKIHILNRRLRSDQAAVEEENKNLYEVFGEQLERMEASNDRLSKEVQRLTAELQGLRVKYADREQVPVLHLGDERDLYEGEIREIILEIISEYKKNCADNTRRNHIISDLLECNEYRQLPEKRREQLKKALKGYRSLNGSLKSLLESMGFEISDDGKHYKWIYFGDHRYMATVSKTCSDGRAGYNIFSEIDKLMF